MKNCIFCKIISGEINALKIYENDKFISILDAVPKTKGHTLVLPKRHIKTVEDLNDEELKYFGDAIRESVKILDKGITPDGFTIGINHGKVAGQAINHLHVHIMPRFSGDGGGSIHSIIEGHSSEDIDKVYKEIINKKEK